MKKSTTTPKTFSVYCKKANKEGYLRFVASTRNDTIEFLPKLVEKTTEASKYVNLDNVKEEAQKLLSKYRFDEVTIIDDKTKKSYHVNKKS